MALKKKLSKATQFIIVGVALIAIQIGFISVFGGPDANESPRSVIDKAVASKPDLSSERKVVLKVQLALTDFRSQKNKLPESLAELVPVYFDSIPLDPSSGKPFEYRIEGRRYYLGNEATKRAAGVTGGGLGAVDAQGRSIVANEIDAIIASIDKPVDSSYVYDPSGRVDPFAPTDLSPKTDDASDKTPLERFKLEQLRLTAVVASPDGPTAFVEDSNGRGYSVKKNTKIGPNGGEVVEVLPDSILVLESETDFAGETKTRTFEMRISGAEVKGKKSRGSK